MERYSAGRVYTFDLPPQFGPRSWPASSRLCIEAIDPSANTRPESRARFRYVKRR